MADLSAAYLAQAQALLPTGRAWPRAVGATLTKLLGGIADQLARLDRRAVALIDEATYRPAELLSDWERVAGLPDSCVGGEQTLTQRREALIARLTSTGGQSRQYYTDLAWALGFEITIDEFAPATVDDDVDTPLYDEAWTDVWRVNEPPSNVRYATVDDDVDTPLAWWGSQVLHCMIERLKPAHTVVLWGLISYPNGVPAVGLYDDAARHGRQSTIAAIQRLAVVINNIPSQWS